MAIHFDKWTFDWRNSAIGSKSSIKFYNKHLEPIGTSCGSLLANYFDLDLYDFKKGLGNKTDLFERIETGMFSKILRFGIDRDTRLEGPLCPLLFKNSEISNFGIEQFQSNSFFKKYLEFMDLNETFSNAQEIGPFRISL